MNRHDMHVAEKLAINEDIHKWYGWGSPVGLVIALNGMALFAILIKYLIVMK
jgi:hypothetical protein